MLFAVMITGVSVILPLKLVFELMNVTALATPPATARSTNSEIETILQNP
jgi:hypothetical protein